VRLLGREALDLDGSETVLGEAITDDEGDFEIRGVERISGGMYLEGSACGGGTDELMVTITPIKASSYEDLADDEVLDQDLQQVAGGFRDTMQEGLDLLSGTLDLEADGLVLGAVLDHDRGALSGATVGCSDCEMFYLDSEASDGLFSTAEEDGSYSANLGTTADGYARWAAPGAAETRFEPALEGYSWTRRRLKAHPGKALVYIFRAD
jgi:hypothetical protein